MGNMGNDRARTGGCGRRRLPVASVVGLSLLLAAGCGLDLDAVELALPTTTTSPPTTTEIDSATTEASPDGPAADPPRTPPEDPTAAGDPADPSPPVPDAPATALVDRLAMTDSPPTSEYRRKAFGDGWDYDPATGCNTRELVLAQESGPGLVVDDRCRPVEGSWVSDYDGFETGDIADLEVDHLVPLSDAWRSGADLWSDERRRSFANDLGDPATLNAVSSRANRSKGDSSPDRWLPERQEARCDYVEGWVRVKHRWGLSVTAAEKSTLVQVLAGC